MNDPKRKVGVDFPKLTGPAEDALVLDKELDPYFNFLKEACEALGKNAAELLHLTGSPVTPLGVLTIVKAVARDCGQLRSEAWRARELNRALRDAFCQPTASGKERFDALCDYFLRHFPSRSSNAQDMLLTAFEGVLGGIAWTEPVTSATEAAVSAAKADRPDASGVATTPLPAPAETLRLAGSQSLR